jgi:hypothetical protein
MSGELLQVGVHPVFPGFRHMRLQALRSDSCHGESARRRDHRRAERERCMLLLPLLRAPQDRPQLRSGRRSRSVKASVRRGKGRVGPAGRGGRLSPRALLVVFSRRRTHHDYADDLGKIAGRHLAGV